MAEKPIPDGFHTLTPYLVVKDASKAIDFYKRAFGAVELTRHTMPDGKIVNASLRIGDSIFMLNDEFPFGNSKSPETLAGTTVAIHVYVEDVDSAFKRAVDAGAKVEMPVDDMFWGDRYGQVSDPFGHQWSLGTHIKDMTEEEIMKAGAAAMAQMSSPN